MGCRNGEPEPAAEMPVSASACEALLLATICVVGLPAEVQIKDGSLYAGVFHTASLDDGYGVVLKKARMIKKGRSWSNLEVGAIVDTLVVLSNDLVQLVVKDFMFPVEGDIGYCVGDHVREVGQAVDSQSTDAASGVVGEHQGKKSISLSGDVDLHETHDAKSLLKSLHDKPNVLGGRDGGISREEVEEQSLIPVVSVQEGQVGEGEAHAPSNSSIDVASSANTALCEAHQSISCCKGCPAVVCSPQAKIINESHDFTSKKTGSEEERCWSPVSQSTRPEDSMSALEISAEFPSSNALISTISISSSSVSNNNNSTCSNLSASPNLLASSKGTPFCNTFTKESKLNPEAKVFFPSFVSARSTSFVSPATIVNTSYVSSIPSVIPAGATQSSLEISSFPSCAPLPAKFVQYSPLVGQTGISTQYLRPISGHSNARQLPIRFNGQHHPIVQTGTAYMHQSAQPVMVGRTGQLVYVHPIFQDPMQVTTAHSQGFPVLTSCHANMPKVEGTPAQSLQFCVTPPLVSAAPVQPFAIHSAIPFSSHIPAIQPVAVPGGNGFFGSKFQ